MLLTAVKKRIAKAHCRVGKIRFKSAPKKKRNRVLSQSPKPGKSLKKGARVNLVVGRVKH